MTRVAGGAAIPDMIIRAAIYPILAKFVRAMWSAAGTGDRVVACMAIREHPYVRLVGVHLQNTNVVVPVGGEFSMR